MLSPWLTVTLVVVMGCYSAVSLERQRGPACTYLGEKQIRRLAHRVFPLEVSLIILSLILWACIADGVGAQLILSGILAAQGLIFLWVVVTDFIGFLACPTFHSRIFVLADPKAISGHKSWWWVPVDFALTPRCVGNGFVITIPLHFHACEEVDFKAFEDRCRRQAWRLKRMVEEGFKLKFDYGRLRYDDQKFITELNSRLPQFIYEFLANEPGIEVDGQIRVDVSNRTHWVNMLYLIA